MAYGLRREELDALRRRQALAEQQAQPSRYALGSPYGVAPSPTAVKAYEAPVVIRLPIPPPQFRPPLFGEPRPPSVAETILWEKVFKPERTAEETKITGTWQQEVTKAETVSKQEFGAQIATIKAEATKQGIPPEQMKAWEKEQWGLYEKEVSGWKVTEERKYGSWLESWRKQWQPKGLAERMIGFKTQPITQLTPTGFEFKTRPLAPVAGIVASYVESPIYSIGQIGGYKTPRPPPTWLGTLTTKGLGVLAGQKEWVTAGSAEYARMEKEFGKEYIGGTIIGDVLLSITLGKVVSKGAESYLTERYLRLGPAKWKGLPEKILMKVTGAKPYIAYGEVAIPDITRGAIGLKELEASTLAWEMTLTPRTGGVWVGKILVEEPVKEVLPVLISRGGAISIGYLHEYGFRREVALTPMVSQTQLTRMGIYPYIPKATIPTITGKAIMEIGVGFGVSALLRVPQKPKRRGFPVVTPKVWQPTFTYERLKYSPIQPISPRQRERAIPIPKISTVPIQKYSPIQAPILKTEQLPTLVLKIPVPTTLKIPTPTIPKIPTPFPTPPPFYLPRGGDAFGFGRGKDLLGKWFKREHPIKSPEQMMRTFKLGFGLDRPTRRRRKR